MSKRTRLYKIFYGLSLRQMTAALTLACGQSISATAREVKVGRNTIYQWLKQPDFQNALQAARIAMATSREIWSRCLQFQQRIFWVLAKVFSGVPDGDYHVDRFRRQLIRLDKKLKLSLEPYISDEMFEQMLDEWDARYDIQSRKVSRKATRDRIKKWRKQRDTRFERIRAGDTPTEDIPPPDDTDFDEAETPEDSQDDEKTTEPPKQPYHWNRDVLIPY